MLRDTTFMDRYRERLSLLVTEARRVGKEITLSKMEGNDLIECAHVWRSAFGESIGEYIAKATHRQAT